MVSIMLWVFSYLEFSSPGYFDGMASDGVKNDSCFFLCDRQGYVALGGESMCKRTRLPDCGLEMHVFELGMNVGN